MVKFTGGILTSSCRQHMVRGEFICTLCQLPSKRFLGFIKYPLQFCISKKSQKRFKQLLYKIPIQTTGHGNVFFKPPICFHRCKLRQTHNTNANSYNTRAIDRKSSGFTKCTEAIKFVSRCL